MSVSEPLRLALFDCDGTLVDSQRSIVSAMAAACADEGLAPPTPQAVRAMVGLPLTVAVAQLMPALSPEARDRLVARYHGVFQEQRRTGALHEPLYPGIVEALDAIEADGVMLGIVTGKSRRGLVATLDGHGLLDRFTTIQTGDDGPGKPHPVMVHQALDRVGVDADSAVVIGDTTFDMEMARSAGTRSIGVAWGYHDEPALEAAGADRIVACGEALPAVVFELLGRSRSEG